MRIVRTLSAFALAASLSIAVAPPAHAESDADIALARTLGYQAQEAYDKKDYKKAEDLFRKAHALYKGAVTLSVGLARSLAFQKKYVEASETYNRIIREGVPANASQGFKDGLAAAQKEIEDVTAKIAKVTITVKDASGADVPNPKVMIDTEVVNNAGLGVARPTDPGAHKVTVTADGYKASEKSFNVEEGRSTDVPIQMEKEGGTAVIPPVTDPKNPNPNTTVTTTDPNTATTTAGNADTGVMHKSGSKVPALVAFGVGGVGLIVGGITGVLAMGKNSDLTAACPNSKCGSAAQSDLDSYHSLGTISTVGFIVGVAGVGAGVVLWLTSGGSSSAPQKAGIIPYVGLGNVGAFGRF